MNTYLTIDPWKLMEQGFHPEHQMVTESLFSLGNGRFGQRGCFEETYTGKTLQGNYLAGVYYPDKTRVGWWKNGYPEYFAKVLNAIDWSSLRISMEGEEVDLHQATCESFYRELDMKRGVLSRQCDLKLVNGDRISIASERYCHAEYPDLGILRYQIRIREGKGTLAVQSYLDLDVQNQDANWEEKFWEDGQTQMDGQTAVVSAYTRKTRFRAAAAMVNQLSLNGTILDLDPFRVQRDKYVELGYELDVEAGDEIILTKMVSMSSTLYYDETRLPAEMMTRVEEARLKGYSALLKAHEDHWARKWQEADIVIDGDLSAQQAIRFNIFQLYQTYTGDDDRLNIGPKGFTGEKYGGSTYWDTEAYCLPFYLATASPQVARQLLLYRHRQLPQAIANARKLGFSGGAALFPMVTMNGEECHNEWEITFEEIHRNGASAYAIHDYVRYTGDRDYLWSHGLEVLIAISRFWAQRVHWSSPQQRYVMHGVTGPNEYENNVNNNWYTLYIARWCLTYTRDVIHELKSQDPKAWLQLADQLKFYEHTELRQWQEIVDFLYLPEDKELGIFLQQDGYLEKEQALADSIPADQRPLNEHWSWDRILRSCFIKQADVLQGFYFFEEDFDLDQLRRNYQYYEPRTVHESSLSPCVHAILACSLDEDEKAYEMMMRTARLDLDNINNDTKDGCHITSMAGTWMAVVKGFGGMRVRDDQVGFSPRLPEAWSGLNFRVRWRGRSLEIAFDRQEIRMTLLEGAPLPVRCYEEVYSLSDEIRVRFRSPNGPSPGAEH